MSGHSKWSTIKRQKAIVDSKRGKVFTKLAKEIQVAARLGGSNLDGNPRLRDAISEARANSMPKENIERAVKKGSGELEGQSLEEITYEGYGPGGVALLIESMTDNRNRTVADLRALITRGGGNLGESGSVSWMFEKKGVLTVAKSAAPEERLMEIALEAGAEDISDEGDHWQVTTGQHGGAAVKAALEENKIPVLSTGVSAIPKSTVAVAGDHARQLLKLMDQLEDLDDVQRVYANFDISDADLERISHS